MDIMELLITISVIVMFVIILAHVEQKRHHRAVEALLEEIRGELKRKTEHPAESSEYEREI